MCRLRTLTADRPRITLLPMSAIQDIAGDDATKARWMIALALTYGHLPTTRYLAANITHPYTSYEPSRQAQALSDWIRSEIRYVREAGEQLQTPFQTLRARIGDCDDLVILAAALATSIGLRWRYAWYQLPFAHVAIDMPGPDTPWKRYELTR